MMPSVQKAAQQSGKLIRDPECLCSPIPPARQKYAFSKPSESSGDNYRLAANEIDALDQDCSMLFCIAVLLTAFQDTSDAAHTWALSLQCTDMIWQSRLTSEKFATHRLM